MNQGYIDIFKHDSKLKIKMSSEERAEWNVTPHAVHEAQRFLNTIKANRMSTVLRQYFGRSEVCDSVN